MSATQPSGLKVKKVLVTRILRGRLMDSGRRSIGRVSRYQRSRFRNESRGRSNKVFLKDHGDPKGRTKKTAKALEVKK